METLLLGLVSLVNSSQIIDEQLVHDTAVFIAKEEGLRTEVYDDSGGMAICYGAKAYSPDEVKTKDECWDMLVSSTRIILVYVDELVDEKLTNNQMISLSSLAYNVSTADELFAYINEDNPTNEEIAQEIRLYAYAGGIWMKGLAHRRMREAELFLKP